MNYHELQSSIKEGTHLPNYYEEVLLNSKDIILDIGMRGQIPVAESIGMAQSKLSVIKPLLVAHINLVQVVYNEDSTPPTSSL